LNNIESPTTKEPHVPAVVFFCHDGAGNVLLARRRDGGWSCGSGTCERGEAPQATAQREIQEEFGVVPKRIIRLGQRRNVTDFLAQVDRINVRNAAPEEHSAILWRDVRRPDTWEKPWHPLFSEFLRLHWGRILDLIPVREAPLIRR